MKLFVLLLINIVISFEYGLANTKPYQFNDVGVNVTLNSTLTDNFILTDEFNKEINLKDIIQDKPTIINFVYLNCPLLCHLMLDGLANVIEESKYNIGKDYQIVTISIDPKETNKNLRAYKKKYLEQLNINNGWQFLKGNQIEIEKITNFFGYGYKYIKRTNDYAHPSVIFFYNKKLTNYIEGVTYNKTSFDYSLMTLKENKTIKEKIVTYCYYFDPETQTYSLLIFKILRLLCLLTVAILFIMIVYFIYRERKIK
ncbi:MAG: SCO family protein [Candidatus Margulisiibacteriota bacterium]